MRSLLRKLLYLVVALVLLGVGLFVFGPYEGTDLAADFDEGQLADGVSPYFADREARFEDITPGAEKRVIWHDTPEMQTDLAVLYIHGFSATAAEIRPVPDLVAERLQANLIYTRLTGHGRSGEALAQGIAYLSLISISEEITGRFCLI